MRRTVGNDATNVFGTPGGATPGCVTDTVGPSAGIRRARDR